MHKKDSKSSKIDFSPIFPLEFSIEQNSFILSQNSFANKLIQLHIGNKYESASNKNPTWYLHPQEVFYLISVLPYDTEEQQKSRQKLILQIYKTSQLKDIDTIHFYLNVRKRNKFCRRVDKYLFKTFNDSQKKQDTPNCAQHKEDLITQVIQKLRLFKIYSTNQDYKNDQNFKFCLLAHTEDKISSLFFDSQFQKVKKALGIQTLQICIFENNDFVMVQVKSL